MQIDIGFCMIKKIIFTVLAVFIFSGCASYNAFSMFQKDTQHEKALLNTKNAQITNSLETKAKITATYLNSVYPSQYKDAEYFFIGVFIPDDYDNPKESGLFNKGFKLMMEDKTQKEVGLGSDKAIKGYMEPLTTEYIARKDESVLYKNMPHTDNWSRYYVVSFPKQKGVEPLNLKLKSTLYGEAALSFPRVGLD
jgi:hypothetical protein